MKQDQVQVAIYARTSTSDQHHDVQLDQLRETAARRGWNIVNEYVDAGVSSGKRSRPAFDAMLRDAEGGKFSLIFVAALDRLSRSLQELLTTSEKLSSWGVDLVSERENIDSSGATGKLVFHILGAVAEFERALLRERTIAGMEAARKRGRQLGRPRLEVDTDLALELRAKDVPWSRVARRLQVSESTARRAVARRLALRESLSKSPSGQAPKN